jgi:hypothetical protein
MERAAVLLKTGPLDLALALKSQFLRLLSLAEALSRHLVIRSFQTNYYCNRFVIPDHGAAISDEGELISPRARVDMHGLRNLTR